MREDIVRLPVNTNTLSVFDFGGAPVEAQVFTVLNIYLKVTIYMEYIHLSILFICCLLITLLSDKPSDKWR